MAVEKQSIKLNDVTLLINGNIVGGAQELTADVSRDNTEVYDSLSYNPREIMDGNIHTSGTLTRLFLDTELIKELTSDFNGTWPAFTLTGVTKNKSPQRKITITGAKLSGFSFSGLNLDGPTTRAMNFMATGYREE